MFIVLAFFYIIHHSNRQTRNLTDDNKPNKSIAFVVFAYIIFWAGMRNSFIDTFAYKQTFEWISWEHLSTLDFSFNSGWGFDFLTIIFKHLISKDSQHWLMFVAIVSGLCIGITFYKYSHNYFYSVFLFLATTNFTWLMNGIRQFLAVAIIFAATPLIKENKWFKFLLIVLLASTFHGTALLMLPVFFFVRSKPWTSRTMLLFAGVLFVLFFTSSFTNILEEIFAETQYENIGDKILNDDGVNPIRVLVFSVTTILAFFARNHLPKDDIIVNIFVNMSLVTSGLYLIAMATSGILLGRLPIYTQLYQYMLLPYLIDKYFEKKTKNLVYFLSIVLFLFYFKISIDGFAATNRFYYSSDLTGAL